LVDLNVTPLLSVLIGPAMPIMRLDMSSNMVSGMRGAMVDNMFFVMDHTTRHDMMRGAMRRVAAVVMSAAIMVSMAIFTRNNRNYAGQVSAYVHIPIASRANPRGELGNKQCCNK
jgi:hypothetical protein